MKHFVASLLIILAAAAAAEASVLCYGSVTTMDELNYKIEQLRETIFYSYQKSGIRLWAPFYYWTCKNDESRIFYCYALLPLGRHDETLAHKVNLAVSDCQVDPVYVPVKINRAGSMRS